LDKNKKTLTIPGQQLHDYFSNLHKNNEESEIPEIEQPENKILDNERLNKPFSKKEFKAVINALKSKKAEGYDGISNEMIKNSPDNILHLINRLMNLCLENL